MRLAISCFLCGTVALVTANAQAVISAHSGVVHYVEGDVFVADKLVELKFGHFPDIRPNETLRTGLGRAEILLTPGSFLRVGENSEIKMISNHLSDTRFELLKGEIVVETVGSDKDSAAAMVKGNSIAVIYKDTTTTVLKAGLYQFTSDPPRLRVFEGEATVKSAAEETLLKKGKQTTLDGAVVADKFDSNDADELMRWSSRRSGYLAAANVSAARSLSYDPNLMTSYLGSGFGYGGWAWDPMFGMFTYVPFGGIGFSPFGYSYWSPYSVYYSPFGYGYGYGGYYGGPYYGGSSGGGGVYRSPGTVRSVGHVSGASRAFSGGFSSGSRSGGSGGSFGGGRGSWSGGSSSIGSGGSSSVSSAGSFGGGRSGGGGGLSSGGRGR